MLNNITKNLTSNKQEVQTAKENKLEQMSKVYAFCGICKKAVSDSEYPHHKEIHFVLFRYPVSKFQQKHNNEKRYFSGYFNRLNLAAQLKSNQSVRPLLKIPKANQLRTTNRKADYLGRAILNTHRKLVSESYW